MKRPFPPGDDVLPPFKPAFAPAPELAAWVNDTFMSEGDWLYNEDHRHLNGVNIGFLWAGAAAERRGRRILGTAQLVAPAASLWPRQMAEYQLSQWFDGRIPIALIIIDAEYARDCSDAEFCALIEHELYHIGQQHDEFGMPAFTKEGGPKLTMRPHDVEEFVGVVRRYGAGVAGENVEAMVRAAREGPEIASVNISHACGNCLLRAA